MRTDPVDIAAALCRRFEGFRSRPYLCPAGVWTVGFGATRYLDGQRVDATAHPLSIEEADHLLRGSLIRDYLPAVIDLCPGADTPQRLAALTDFAFNLGAGRMRASTLRRKVNAGQWDQVPAELAKWVRGGGRVLPGLVARRAAEAALVG